MNHAAIIFLQPPFKTGFGGLTPVIARVFPNIWKEISCNLRIKAEDENYLAHGR